MPIEFFPWTIPAGNVCSGTPDFGSRHAAQCTKVPPPGKSGSVMISATSLAAFGTLPNFSGGDALEPSHVKPLGIALLLPNAALVTVSFLTFDFSACEPANDGPASAPTTRTGIATSRDACRIRMGSKLVLWHNRGMPDDTPAAILLDYYGTLAHATHWISADDVLAEHGYELPLETRDRWFNDGIDGIEHLEQSRSRDDYMAWQRERLLGMLAETDVHPGEYEMILEKLREGASSRVLEAYPEVPGVLVDLPSTWAAPRRLLELGLGPHPGRRRGGFGRPGRRPGVVGVGRRTEAAPAHLRAHADEARGRAGCVRVRR